MKLMRRLRAVTLCFVAAASVAAGEPVTLVAWAPGFPGTTEQAQPSMDEFAAGVARAAGWNADDFRAIYHPEVDAGRATVSGEATVAIVPLAVFFEYGEALKLRPMLRVIQEGGSEETWSLVARKGALTSPADLAGWSLQGHPGFSPRFVRRALAGWGELPDDVEIRFNARVLSVLRKAAQGEPVAALLDRAQAEALGRLPFADDLEVVAVSEPTISSLVCAVDERLSERHERALVEALQELDGSANGDELLATIRVVRFELLGKDGLAGVQRLWSDAAD